MSVSHLFWEINLAVCQRILNEFSLIIDITYEPMFPTLVENLRAANAPYVHVELTNRPFLRAFLRFIEHTGTHDAAIIFNDERGMSIGSHSAQFSDGISLTWFFLVLKSNMKVSTRFWANTPFGRLRTVVWAKAKQIEYSRCDQFLLIMRSSAQANSWALFWKRQRYTK